MQKQAPSVGKIMVALGFTLSCFALLLFLWVTFGGAIPFKPASYRFTADFSEAITLQKEADVRIGGVSVGKVKDLNLPPDGNATRVEIEIDPEYAPISSDAMATLRQKTLLGETYIELTTGTQVDSESGEPAEDATAQSGTTDVSTLNGDDAASPIEEGGHLESTQVQEQVQIDEIFKALDEETRQSFQLWMKNAAVAIDGRGLDLNDAFGNLGPFSQDASDVLSTLREQETALRSVVRNTGTVFQALTAREEALSGAVVGSNRTFRALASRDEALADTFQIFPTFQRESRFTLERLERFAEDAGPLFEDLKPVARDLSPTLRDLRRLSPNARRLFKNLNPLTKSARTGLPGLRDFLDELRPVMTNLDPFLANLNPIVRYLGYYRAQAGDFLANPAAGTAGYMPSEPGQPNPRHLSRQMTITNPESLSIYPQRLATNRGNGYLMPFSIGSQRSTAEGAVFPNFDCANTGSPNPGGEVLLSSGGAAPSTPVEQGNFPLPAPSAFPPCTLQQNDLGLFPTIFGGGRLPQILPDP